MNPVLGELRQRWGEMFEGLAAGGDLPPGQRLRAEGMMEAALLAGLASAETLDQLMDEAYCEAFGRDMASDFGEDWRAFHPFPEIPAVARRAPVYPSTRD